MNFQIHFHDIAAHGIADFPDTIGVGQFTDIARVGKWSITF
jgi:hypothetical protein